MSTDQAGADPAHAGPGEASADPSITLDEPRHVSWVCFDGVDATGAGAAAADGGAPPPPGGAAGPSAAPVSNGSSRGGGAAAPAGPEDPHAPTWMTHELHVPSVARLGDLMDAGSARGGGGPSRTTGTSGWSELSLEVERLAEVGGGRD
jgi:hypothetical protein